jgi:hypothetical protein
VWQIKAADVVLAEWIEFLTLADSALVAEQIAVNVNKVLADSAALADILNFAIGLGKEDTPVFSDAEIRSFTKVLADSAAVIDALSLALTKVLTDAASFADEADKSTGKVASDSASASDIRVNHFYKVAFSGYAIDYFLEDYTEATDYVYFSESQTRAITKVLSDTIGATDDLNGVLADDDQVISLFKSIDHVANISEQKAFSLVKPQSDAFAASDSAALTSGLFKQDAASFLDTQVFSLGLNKTDTASVSDALVLSGTKPLSDSATAADSAVFSVTLNKADAAGFSDAQTFAFTKVLSETPALSDALLFALVKPLSDSASLSESAALQFNRPASDSASISDASVRSPVLGKSDTATFTDSGSLLNQDYCEAYYFAEDYVGTSRTF